MVNLFTMLGWSLFVVGVVVAVFEVAIESQSGRVNVKGTALNVLKGFFAASLVGVLPVQLYKTCCHLQGIFTADLAGIFAGEQSSTIGAFAGQILSLAFDPNAAVQVGLKLIFFLVTLSREKQPLIHCAVFLELKAKNMSALESLQSDISMELTRSKITADRLTLRQKEGFLSAMFTPQSSPFGGRMPPVWASITEAVGGISCEARPRRYRKI